MKLSCFADFAPGETLTQRANYLVQAGFDAMELVGKPDEIKALMPEARQILDGGRLRVSAICALHRGWLVDPDAEARRAAKEDIRALLDLAGELDGCGVFVIPILGYTHAYPGGPRTGRTPDGDREVLIEGLSELAAYAHQARATLFLEVINRYESPVANTLAEGAEIARRVAQPAFRLNADFFHMNIEEADPAAALWQCGTALGHIHAGDSTRTYPGFGNLDYPKLVRALVEGGYDQYLTVDARDLRLDPHRVLTAVCRYLRGLISLVEERACLAPTATVSLSSGS